MNEPSDYDDRNIRERIEQQLEDAHYREEEGDEEEDDGDVD